MSRKSEFIPHNTCTVSSGDCFIEGRCLDGCQTRLSAADANKELTEALHLLRNLSSYIVDWKSTTNYVSGSWIDLSVKKAEAILERNQL